MILQNLLLKQGCALFAMKRIWGAEQPVHGQFWKLHMSWFWDATQGKYWRPIFLKRLALGLKSQMWPLFMGR